MKPSNNILFVQDGFAVSGMSKEELMPELKGMLSAMEDDVVRLKHVIKCVSLDLNVSMEGNYISLSIENDTTEEPTNEQASTEGNSQESVHVLQEDEVSEGVQSSQEG